MPFPEVLPFISEAFQKEMVPFVLVGGFAVNQYKFSRRTIDIDFMTTEEGYEKVRPSLEQKGYKEFRRTRLFVRLREEAVGAIDVDILFVDENTLGGVLKEGKETEILGTRFIVPSLHHLIAMKLHAMKYDQGNRDFRDLRDIAELIKINRVDVTTNDFRNLCLKFGTEKVYQKILEAAKGWKN